MYEEYWQLKEKPFRNTPDPRFFFSSKQHEDALMKLTYAVSEGMGAAMMTGVFGCGKTLVGNMLTSTLGTGKHKVALVTNPAISAVELLRAIVRNLMSTKLPDKKTELLADSMLETLNEILIDNARDGKETVVIVDEAHIIEDASVFEQIRLLLNFQLESRFLLTLLLFGQPELREKVENFKPLAQRIAIRCHLDKFSLDETKEYIQYRLKAAGRDEKKGIFVDNAVQAIFDHSGGIPRRINSICDLGLLTGFGRKAEKIDAEIVERVVGDFGL